jgi:hypothetical protein
MTGDTIWVAREGGIGVQTGVAQTADTAFLGARCYDRECCPAQTIRARHRATLKLPGGPHSSAVFEF